jgi:hypothetical protein
MQVKKEPSHTLLGECKLVKPLWLSVRGVLKNLIDLPYDPVIPLLGIYLKERKSYASHVYCSSVHYCPTVESAWCQTIDEWMIMVMIEHGCKRRNV